MKDDASLTFVKFFIGHMARLACLPEGRSCAKSRSLSVRRLSIPPRAPAGAHRLPGGGVHLVSDREQQLRARGGLAGYPVHARRHDHAGRHVLYLGCFLRVRAGARRLPLLGCRSWRQIWTWPSSAPSTTPVRLRRVQAVYNFVLILKARSFYRGRGLNASAAVAGAAAQSAGTSALLSAVV